jgi:hypothetical protein
MRKRLMKLSGQDRVLDDYWRAYRRWKKIGGFPVDAANRLTREEANERLKTKH